MQLPSNKVGLVLITVVFVVASTVFLSTFEKVIPTVNPENVQLVISRDPNSGFKSGDADGDDLPDWLEEFYRSDPKVADTDGDGTNDGAEVEADRDPTKAAPNDPLITKSDLIRTEANMDASHPGSLTDQTSIDLFAQYLTLKKAGTLSGEEGAKLVDELSQKVAIQASLKNIYTASDLNVSESTTETITIYGDRLAQETISFYTQLDSYQNLQDTSYFAKLSNAYKTFAQQLTLVRVPTVAQEAHLHLANYMYQTSVMLSLLATQDTDSMTALVVTNQYKSIHPNETELYTTLGLYFKNNGILFDTESTTRFWNIYQN